jgi:hypothetical protein
LVVRTLEKREQAISLVTQVEDLLLDMTPQHFGGDEERWLS